MEWSTRLICDAFLWNGFGQWGAGYLSADARRLCLLCIDNKREIISSIAQYVRNERNLVTFVLSLLVLILDCL